MHNVKHAIFILMLGSLLLLHSQAIYSFNNIILRKLNLKLTLEINITMSRYQKYASTDSQYRSNSEIKKSTVSAEKLIILNFIKIQFKRSIIFH